MEEDEAQEAAAACYGHQTGHTSIYNIPQEHQVEEDEAQAAAAQHAAVSPEFTHTHCSDCRCGCRNRQAVDIIIDVSYTGAPSGGG